jgi:type IV secretion system protein VirD4
MSLAGLHNDRLLISLTVAALVLLPDAALAQSASPFMTGATALQTNILAWLTPVAVILVMVLGAMAMANRMLKSLAARIVFAPKDFSDAREISDELGSTTVRARTISKPLGMALDRRSTRGRSQSVSEQRRPLLLPQEVKELGGEEAIVFYEGLRPIRCRKIRYFADRAFRQRLVPPPAVPVPAGDSSRTIPSAASAAAGESSVAQATLTPPLPAPPPVMTRDGTADDVERLDSLTLEDFDADVSKLQVPEKDGPLTESELKVAVDGFLESLKRDRGESRGR